MKHILKVARFDDGTVQEIYIQEDVKVESYYKTHVDEERDEVETPFEIELNVPAVEAFDIESVEEKMKGRCENFKCPWQWRRLLVTIAPILANVLLYILLAWAMNPFFTTHYLLNCTSPHLYPGSSSENCTLSNYTYAYNSSENNSTRPSISWPPFYVAIGNGGGACAVSVALWELAGDGVLCNNNTGVCVGVV
nr:envelop glycoprotein 48 [Equid gammaherpesvirus 5]